MKTILFSLATTETAGPSAEVSVPTRKSTLSLRMSSRACRTASFAGFGVADDQLELPAQDAALGVGLLDEHHRALRGGFAEEGRRARERHRHADLDRLLGFGAERRDEQGDEQHEQRSTQHDGLLVSAQNTGRPGAVRRRR